MIKKLLWTEFCLTTLHGFVCSSVYVCVHVYVWLQSSPLKTNKRTYGKFDPELRSCVKVKVDILGCS